MLGTARGGLLQLLLRGGHLLLPEGEVGGGHLLLERLQQAQRLGMPVVLLDGAATAAVCMHLERVLERDDRPGVYTPRLFSRQWR
ncbi:hypothetical protein GY12_23155 [Micrococcus luteus]|nr:hypothetical protein GY12_23155 [Micrococcus luteus]